METLTKYFVMCRKLSENGIFNEIDDDKDAVMIGKQTYIKLDSYDGKWLLHCAGGDYYFKTPDELVSVLTSSLQKNNI